MTNSGAFQYFKNNNKGSAILTVVIAMMFVVALGTALLYSSYHGFLLTVLARNDKENFYDASAAMDEIKVGVQDEVSSALKEAYSNTLVAYGKGDMKNMAGDETYDPQEAFKAAFLRAIDNSQTFTVDYDAALQLSKVSVDTDTLKEFASSENWKEKKLEGKSEAKVSDDGFTISDLTLTCVSKGGYESIISTDLNIAIPKFFTGSAVSSDIGRYAVIADKGISVSSTGDKAITGGVYAGTDGISVETEGDLSLTGGNILTAGSISAENNTSLTIDPSNYDIWAREIEVGKNSKTALNGNIYVADDLVIGGGSDVTLKGSYYGFGSDDASTVRRSDESSSSIFVNSYEKDKKASLNINGLKQLTLAGVSFINVSKDTNADENIVTGESVAAKPDQLAYLLPAEALYNYKTNPTVLSKDESGAYKDVKVNTDTVLWSIDSEEKTIADYIGDADVKDNIYVGKYGRIVSCYTQNTDKNPCTGYFFINFTDQSMANRYFKDYFTAKPNSIGQYLDIYLDLSKYNPEMTEITKGNSYRTAGTDEHKSWENILGTASFPNSQAQYYKSIYKNLSVSPLKDYIDRDKLSDQKNKTLKFKFEDKTVAIVCGGNYSYNTGEPSDIRVILASGDVTVSRAFEGIIISGGTVMVNAPISYKVPTSEVLISKAEDGTLLSDYLNEKMFNGEKSNSDNEWSPDRLVYYSNWQKN